MTGHSDGPWLDSRDGYRSELLEAADGTTSSYLELIAGGEPVVEPERSEFFAGADQPWQLMVLVRREHYLYQALARFMNAGGTLFDIEQLTQRFANFVESSPKLSLPEGVKIIDVIEESVRQIVFLDEKTEIATIQTEDEWIDQVPLTELASRIPGMKIEPHDGDHPSL